MASFHRDVTCLSLCRPWGCAGYHVFLQLHPALSVSAYWQRCHVGLSLCSSSVGLNQSLISAEISKSVVGPFFFPFWRIPSHYFFQSSSSPPSCSPWSLSTFTYVCPVRPASCGFYLLSVTPSVLLSLSQPGGLMLPQLRIHWPFLPLCPLG